MTPGVQLISGACRSVVMRGVELADVGIYGEIANVTVNGVDMGPLINAELERQYPDRVKLRLTTSRFLVA